MFIHNIQVPNVVLEHALHTCRCNGCSLPTDILILYLVYVTGDGCMSGVNTDVQYGTNRQCKPSK